MVKKLAVILAILLLSGCASEQVQRETVMDASPTAVKAWTEDSYELIFGIPEAATLAYSENCCNCYVVDDGAMEIYGVKLLASDMESAVKRLSGYEADALKIMELSRFSLPEYRFCWYAQSGEGARNYTADIVIDDIYTYAIVCSTAEQAGNQYSELAQSVFSSFGLYFDEGV